MLMTDPYQTPKSKLTLPSFQKKALIAILFAVAVALTCNELISWYLVPILNSAFAKAFSFTGIDYWTLRLSFDLVNSTVVFVFAVTLATRHLLINAYVISCIAALVGFGIFYYELGGYSCIGRCGLPAWYDIAGFISPFIRAFLGGAIGNAFNKRKQARPLRGLDS